MSKRKHITHKIAQLDPDKDHQEIAKLLANYAFHWDVRKALQLALFRTYAVPSISKLLSATGEFKNRPRKRYDDTELLLAEILENGYDSPKAKLAFERINAMHNSYRISNEDFLYVLSTFVFIPIYWIGKYGWRPLTANEQEACYRFYQEMGKRMGIRNIPASQAEFEAFHKHYEVKNFKYAASNREIGDYTTNLLLSFYLPGWLFWLGRPFAYALMDEPLRQAMGFPQPSFTIQTLANGLLKVRAIVMKYLPERKTPYLLTKEYRPSYPQGYQIEKLGTLPRQKDV